MNHDPSEVDRLAIQLREAEARLTVAESIGAVPPIRLARLELAELLQRQDRLEAARYE